MSHGHYVKTVRDAALPMDAAMHRLITNDFAHSWNGTKFEIHDRFVTATPRRDDDQAETVMRVLAEEFSKAGWSVHSESLPRHEDPSQRRISVSFGHPSSKTRLGLHKPARPTLLYLEVPMPDPAVPITESIIAYWSEQAANTVSALMAQQVVTEEGKMPGSPGQGGDSFRPPAVQQVEPYDPSATAPRPLYRAFGVEEDEEGEQ